VVRVCSHSNSAVNTAAIRPRSIQRKATIQSSGSGHLTGAAHLLLVTPEGFLGAWTLEGLQAPAEPAVGVEDGGQEPQHHHHGHEDEDEGSNGFG
jgi:hypothetical protein